MNVDTQSSLIAELLELSRIRTRPQKRTAVDMGSLVRELAGTFEFELKNRNIEMRIDPEMPTLYAEKSRMREVFQNLIDNAIKYMDRKEGGLIEIRHSTAGGFHTFCIADNGPGIPREEQKRIFQVFQRSSAAKVQGKGVGLALVKSVVANYNGRAWVRSDPGKGATFFLALEIKNTVLPEREPVHERQ